MTSMTISIELSAEEIERLTRAATRLGVRPEELAHAILTDALNSDQEEFHRAAEYVLAKNRELYRRLA
jgi:antitoxin FitA